MSPKLSAINTFLWIMVVFCVTGLVLLLRQQSAREQDRAQATTQMDDSATIAMDISADGQLIPSTQRVADFTFEAPSFALIDQAGKPFSSEQLKGKVWTAMLFFTECQGVCPGMVKRIREINQAVADQSVQFVSFTVDPETDTPERLQQYVSKANVDSSRWHLLTGTIEQMKEVATGLKLPFSDPASHSSKILLIDRKQIVRGMYDPQNTEDMFRMLEKISILLSEEAGS